MEFKDILYTKNDGIAWITLNRPERYNAFSVNMIKSWARALLDAKADDDVKVVVVTGAGKAFCSGGDIKSMREGKGFLYSEEGSDGKPGPMDFKKSLWELIHRIPLILEDLDKPVIAAINGPATGAGLDMALMCDLRIASDKATFAESYVRMALVPGDGGAFFLPRLVGLPKALEMLWTGEMIDAGEALRIGLVNRVVPADQLEEATRELARKLAEGPQLSIRMIKRLVYQGLRSDLRTALDTVSSHMAVITSTEDHKEAVNAFFEKRKPVFKGR
ncbi:MAG: enoyl-CoA hydratase/isomerase family protein [Peptococcaceae bacterium]|nr:enoyl-CoA hydratase/isomerase family protein [Peptococcaceae bacterium]